MDFDKILAPYKDRSAGVYIKWLQKKGVPPGIIDTILVQKCQEIEKGRVYKDGMELDRDILDAAIAMNLKEIEESFQARISGIQKQLDSEWEGLTKWQKIWQVITGRA
jgi:hypothetical protein